MFGWFDRQSTSGATAPVSSAKGCTTVGPATMESLEGRLVFSAVTQAEAPPVALGGNLQFQSEGVRDHAMANLVKTTSGFKNLSGGKATVDANGWATQDFVVPLWQGSAVDPGQYKISFTGPSNTLVSLARGKGTLTKVTTSAGVNNWTLDVPTGATELQLKFTGTTGQVKNLAVMQPGTSVGQVWNPKYVNLLNTLKPATLRFMDIVKVNYSTTANWSERPKATDANYNRAGIPWEDLIDLANQVGSNVWVCVPARATDDYVTQLATLLKQRLNPGLQIYIEYGNEMWGGLYDSGKYNLAQAKAEVAANPSSDLNYDNVNDQFKWQDRRTARRLMQISNIFKNVWTSAGETSPINNRVKAVLGGQAVRPDRYDNMLGFINSRYGAPRNFFYGVGAAWYWGLNKYNDRVDANGNPVVFTKEQILEGMSLSIGTYESERRFTRHADKAAQWGLKLTAYELGVDTSGKNNVTAKAEASRDPRMKGLMERFVRAFQDQAGVEANWYTVGARTYVSTTGTWSVTESLGSLNTPKIQGFRALRGLTTTTPPPPPPPTPTGTVLRAAVDAYVRDGPSAGTNFGSATELLAKRSPNVGNNRETYLRFDLSSVATINTAKLRLFGRLSNTVNASSTTTVYNASNTTWGESTITWNNRPVAGTTARGSVTVTGTTANFYEIDLTSFLKAEKSAGRNLVTLVLRNQTTTDAYSIFNSDENATNKPQLALT